MTRTSLFILVVLVAASAVAGLLALTRTSAASEAKTPTGVSGERARIAYRLQQLDAVEADLRRKIAAASATVPGGSGEQPVIGRQQQPVAVPVAVHDDDSDEHDEVKAHEDGHGDDRDD